jgi:hypothetical protein
MIKHPGEIYLTSNRLCQSTCGKNTTITSGEHPAIVCVNRVISGKPIFTQTKNPPEGGFCIL